MFWSQASLVAHSYGTLVASAISKASPTLVSPGMVLVDPVCFALFLPTLMRNALFFHHPTHQGGRKRVGAQGSQHAPAVAAVGNVKGPVRGSVSRASGGGGGAARVGAMARLLGPLKGLLKGVVVRDIHCAAALTSGFDWAHLNLWARDVPPNTTVVMSEKDHLVPVKDVEDILSNPALAMRGVRVHVLRGKGHGGFILDPEAQLAILATAPSLVTAPSLASQPQLGACSNQAVSTADVSAAVSVGAVRRLGGVKVAAPAPAAHTYVGRHEGRKLYGRHGAGAGAALGGAGNMQAHGKGSWADFGVAVGAVGSDDSSVTASSLSSRSSSPEPDSNRAPRDHDLDAREALLAATRGAKRRSRVSFSPVVTVCGSGTLPLSEARLGWAELCKMEALGGGLGDVGSGLLNSIGGGGGDVLFGGRVCGGEDEAHLRLPWGVPCPSVHTEVHEDHPLMSPAVNGARGNQLKLVLPVLHRAARPVHGVRKMHNVMTHAHFV